MKEDCSMKITTTFFIKYECIVMIKGKPGNVKEQNKSINGRERCATYPRKACIASISWKQSQNRGFLLYS